MKKALIIIPILLILLLPACKKDKLLITPAYQLDSIAVSELDQDLANPVHLYTYTTGANSIADFINAQTFGGQWYQYQASANGYTVTHSQQPCDWPDRDTLYLYRYNITPGHFDSLTWWAEQGCFGQDGKWYGKQNFYYNSPGSIDKIKDGYYQYYLSDGWHLRWDGVYTFNYSADKLSSINLHANSYSDVIYDSILFQLDVSDIISYPNNYPNQTDLIGFDPNDIVLSYFQDDYWNAPLHIINQSASLHTQSASLIENIHFPAVPYDYVVRNRYHNRTEAYDLVIQYEFDAAHDNRISSMTIFTADPHRDFFTPASYTFYYRD